MTILVDLERDDVADLLPNWQAGTPAEWLSKHPGFEVIARDRASAYTDGARQGALDAVQSVDRWHMLRTIRDAIRALCDRHSAAAQRAARITSILTPATTNSKPEPKAPRLTWHSAPARHHWPASRPAYEGAARLRAAGMLIARIAAQLGVERKTVRHWLTLGRAPTWAKPPRRGGMLSTYAPQLDRCWAEGCTNAAPLWREVTDLDFTAPSPPSAGELDDH